MKTNLIPTNLLKRTISTKLNIITLLSLLFVSISSFSQGTLSNGLMAYYPFTGNANDISGNNNNPTTNTASLTFDRFGNANAAYKFNGTNSFMQVPNNATLNFSNQMSLACWVKVNGFYQGACHWNRIINKGTDLTSTAYWLGYCDDLFNPLQVCTVPQVDPLHQTFHGANANGVWGSGNQITNYIQQNIWYSLVFTNDGTTKRVYLNCVLQDSWPANINNPTNVDDLFFGKMNNIQYPFWFNGDLDEVRIYNRALTQLEVDQYGGCIPCPNDITVTQNKCINQNIQLTARTGSAYSWSPATGLSATNIQNPICSINTNSTYTCTITNTATNCTYNDIVTVNVNPSPTSNMPDANLCLGESMQLNAPLGYTSYSWLPATNISNTTISNPIVSPSVTTTYTVTITNSFGCLTTDDVQVIVNDCGCEDSCNWSLTGNTNVKPFFFIGSKNNADFKVRTNNIQRMVVTAEGNIGLNTTTPLKLLDVNGEAVVRTLPAAAPNDKLVLANTIGELKSLPPGGTNQYLSGNGTWQNLPTGGGGGIVSAADQGVTLEGTTVQLGDKCTNGGGAFKSDREVNMENFNLYFNSANTGKVRIGNNIGKERSCPDLQSRLELDTRGLKAVNDYVSPQPSLSGLRFTDLTAYNPTVENKYRGVLSLDEDGDVIWVNTCCNELAKDDQITSILERLDKLESELKAVKNENTALKSKLNQTEVVLDYKQNILEQNIPNPFAETTTIVYSIINNFSKAVIVFNATNGQVIKSVQLNNAGKGQINISASLVAKGIYSYSLIVDGKLIETKKMIKE